MICSAKVVDGLDGGDGGGVGDEGLGGGGADVDGFEGVVGAAQGVIEVVAEPALGLVFLGVGGLPDFHGAEVRAVGLGVAAAVDDGELAGVKEVLEAGHAGVEGEVVVELVELVFDGDGGAGFFVGVVGEGDDGVEAVVAAGELDDDEDVVVGELGALGDVGEGELGDEGRDGGAEGDDGETAETDVEELATGGFHGFLILTKGRGWHHGGTEDTEKRIDRR
jgi:hypothetical protein